MSSIDLTNLKPKMPSLTRCGEVWREMDFWKKFLIIGFTVALSITALLLIILSFSYVEWNEVALKRNTITNTPYLDKIYENGYYGWGPSYRPIKFISTAQNVDFTEEDALTIFSEGGLEIKIEFSFQYRPIMEKISDLFEEYALSYDDQIPTIAKSILKNIAPQYTMKEYYSARDNISEAMSIALAKGLSEKMHVRIVYFQLNYVILPPKQLEKLLDISVQNQVNIREYYVQEAINIRKTTETMSKVILAEAQIINQTADSDANLMRKTAEARAFVIRQNATAIGFERLFQTLGLNTTELRLSYLYASGLKNSNHPLHLFVNVNSVIIPTIN